MATRKAIEGDQPAEHAASAVRYEAVTKRYAGSGSAAVDDLTLEAPAGEICVLVGPSGCGKTTAMRMVNRTVEITSGDILIGEHSVRDREPAQLRREIGYVIQQIGLFPHRTITENIGAVPHLQGELFKLKTGTDIVHVPYKGNAAALQDLLGGNIQLMFDSIPSSAGAVRSGLLRPLAVTTAKRVAAYPDLPTVAEAGVPGFDIATWYAIWAPPRTPGPIVARLQQAVAAAVAVPEVRERLAVLGADPVADTPDAFAAFCRSEYDRWGRLVREARVTLD